MSQQEYKLEDFIAGCAEGTKKAFITKGAMETARSDLKLNTQDQVLQFIGNGGLEKPYFINSKAWENNPNPSSLIKADAWGFFSGLFHGYIAFFFQPANQKWNIKSFKKNEESDPRNLAFQDLGKLLGLKKEETK